MILTKNKTTLLELKKDLSVMNSGSEILEQKRNILLKEIIAILDKVESKREELNEEVQKSYHLLIKSIMENGKKELVNEAKLPSFTANIESYEKSFLGILVPEINFKVQRNKFPINISLESIYIDLAKESYFKSINLILQLSSIEIKAWKLAKELKKTIIRVNALKNYYIPNFKKDIKDINDSLEEIEREFLGIIKKVASK